MFVFYQKPNFMSKANKIFCIKIGTFSECALMVFGDAHTGTIHVTIAWPLDLASTAMCSLGRDSKLFSTIERKKLI